MKDKTFDTVAGYVILAGMLLSIGVGVGAIAAIVYIAYHFIAKYW